MSKLSNALISELQADRRFLATCPACNNEFRIADAVLFAIGSNVPEKAIEAISAARAEIKSRKEQLKEDRNRMTVRAERTAHAVNLGKIVEKIIPSFSGFTYSSGDCRALFEPIDYLVFSGLTKSRCVNSIHFVDVKSGGARLNQKQKVIKEAIESGRVRFETTVRVKRD